MFRSVLETIVQLPSRAWRYGQHCPYEAIIYGLVLAAIALISKLLLASLALVVVTSGVFTILSD